MKKSIKTKKKYASALKALAKEREFAKISVTDICIESELSRKGFYYHFTDKFGLVCWIFQHEFIDQVAPEIEAEGWKVFEALCNYFYRESEFYKKVFEDPNRSEFFGNFCKLFEPIARKFTQKYFENRESSEIFTNFCCDAILATISRWMTDLKIVRPETFTQDVKNALIDFSRYILLIQGEGDDLKDDLAVRPY